MIKPVSRKYIKRVLILSIFFLSGHITTLFADGLPGEQLITQRWRYLFASRSPLSNPAFINEENYLSAKFAFSSTLNAFRMSELGVVYPIGLYQTAAITWLNQGVDSYEATDNNFIPIPGKEVKNNSNVVLLSYANNLWKGLTIGANVNLFLSTLPDPEKSSLSTGFGLDAGISYHLFNSPVIGSHIFGIDLQNIYVQIFDSEDKYPITLRASLNSTYWEKYIESGVDLTIKDIAVAANQFSDTSSPSLEWDLNLKLGGWIIRFIKAYGLLGFSQEGAEFWGFAGGINMPSINNGRDLSFLYQYISMVNGEAGSHTIYLNGEFGKHREEVYARKMAKMANVAPNDLYIKALELYTQGNYWDAWFLFSQLYVEFPDFFKNDWVSYFIGSCQEELDMRSTAIEGYEQTKQRFSRSAAVPFADLGLMKVYYREDNFLMVEQQFNELNKLGVPDSIKFHGYYVMGESELKKGNHSKAKQLFDLIPDTHPDYVFAQHSAAVCDALNDNIEGAISALENCIQFVPSTKPQEEIINRSFVFLGFIFYEDLTKQEGPLAKAVTALRAVPKTSFYYPDALLGLGWTALKARQWGDCISAGQELVSIADNPVLKAEGSLLQAYAHMIQKNYSNAVGLLSTAFNDLQNYSGPQQEELSSKDLDYQDVRSKYSELASNASELSKARQSSIVISQIDSLHNFQKDYFEKIKSHLKYVDNFQRASFFARSMGQVKDDIEYALATAQKRSGQASESKALEKIKSEDEKLQEELEKLQKELGEEIETE